MTRIKQMHTDTIDPFFMFNQKGENTMLDAELPDKIICSFFKVYNTPGFGFLEKISENALVIKSRTLGSKRRGISLGA